MIDRKLQRFIDNINRKVDEWHKEPNGTVSLQDHLGFTDNEYEQFINDERALEGIYHYRSTGQTVPPPPRPVPEPRYDHGCLIFILVGAGITASLFFI